MTRPVLTDDEMTVLATLAEQGSEEAFLTFAAISARTGLSREAVRAACRSLKAHGLASFRNGLWNDDGEPVGSGYGATPDGRDWHARVLEEEGV